MLMNNCKERSETCEFIRLLVTLLVTLSPCVVSSGQVTVCVDGVLCCGHPGCDLTVDQLTQRPLVLSLGGPV